MSRRALYDLRQDLSAAIKRALVTLYEDGEAHKQGCNWCGSSGRKIGEATILGMYDRYLIKIVVESRHRRRQTAMLTDIGNLAAKALSQIEKEAPLAPDDMDGCSEVYRDEEAEGV